MVEVKATDSAEAKELFSENGVSMTDFSEAMVARDGDSVLGYCLFDATKTTITIRLISPENDILLADGLLRSALFLAAGRGIMEASYEPMVSGDLIDKLGFGCGQNNLIDITNLFSGCGNCKNDK